MHGHQPLIALHLTRQLVDLALKLLQVGQHQLGVDHLDVAARVGMRRHMHHVVVVEAAHDVNDGCRLPDVGQELIAQPFALAGALYQPGDVDELHGGVDGLFRPDQCRQLVDALIGYSHHCLVRLDGSKGIVGRQGQLLFGQRVERRALAHVGQTDDADA